MPESTQAISFRPALEFDYAALAEIFNTGFQNYFVPINLTAATLENICRTESSDLGSGIIAMQHNTPIGLCLVTRRGSRSRVHAMGVAPAYRGKGVGQQMLERCVAAAKARGDSRISLEVITANVGARHLYEKNGFVVERKLLGFTRIAREESFSSTAQLEPVDLLEFADILRLESRVELPWQLNPQTLGQLVRPMQGLMLENKAFVLIGNPEAPSVGIRSLFVRRSAERQGYARRLLETLFSIYPNRTWNISPVVPEGLLEGFLSQFDFLPTELSQLEMHHEFSGSKE